MVVEEERRSEAAKMGRQEEREMELLLDEIPHATSTHRRLFHCGDDCCVDGLDELPPLWGPGCGAGLDLGPSSEGSYSSSSSSASGSGFLSGRLPAPSAAEESALLDKLHDLHLGVGPREPIGPPNDRCGLVMESLVPRGYGAFWDPVLPNSLSFNVDKNPSLDHLLQHYSVDSCSADPWIESWPCGAKELGTNGVLGRSSHHRGNYGGAFASCIDQSYPIPDTFLPSEKIGVDSTWNRKPSDASKSYHDSPSLNGRCTDSPSVKRPQPVRTQRNIEAFGSFGFGDSSIVQGKGLCYMSNRRCDDPRTEIRIPQFDEELHAQGISVKLPAFPLKYDHLMGVRGCMCDIAKDQRGCRFLQRKLDEGKHQVDLIFNGVIDHAVELMVDPFGNYLMQKLLEVCSEEQLMEILLVLKEDPADFVKISLNIHGTRAVQKLIDTLKTRQQIVLVISAIQPGFLDLIKDLNGSHVLQHCLESFAAEDNKFIFDAAMEHCVGIATHRHGCCVLQKYIAHSTGDHLAKLVAEISANGYELARDPFGNYVIQYVLDMKNPLAVANLVAQFEGKYVQLSTQKFSSNVVEKCLKTFGEDDQATIIVELLSVSHFEQLLQDPYANYVIQSALENSKGHLRAALEEAICPHAGALRTSPFCKRIFSRALLKKCCRIGS
ncbi:unnamed protein product [Musa acuminata subsp. malaccensis]|uniref:(wild Malaysian banana) hypothetical protein n=1 Tax=Musa acuminata subsp. malaccensis TaxID=214687 RepID=A0A804KXW1_MUSAM|nr:PREDICTED: uncharacterized protein LOC103969811 [Musa acuminata subsp. malaccensis]CAG1853974.1 unnamed protein product [Musa acuminata subsp. malaccensis]